MTSTNTTSTHQSTTKAASTKAASTNPSTTEMASTKTIQNWMLQSLLSPKHPQSNESSLYLQSTPKLTSQQSLAIYQRSYHARLISCLKEQYRALTYCLGDEVMEAFAEDYLTQFPSKSHSLYGLGEHFPNYLSDTRPDRSVESDERELWVDFMIDLATFERMVFVMFEATGDEEALSQSYNDKSDSEARYRAQRCLSLYASKFPVADYYCAVKGGHSPKLPDCRPCWMVLVRVQYRVRIYYHTYRDYCWLQTMVRNFQEDDGEGQVGPSKTFSNSDLGAMKEQLACWVQRGYLVKEEALAT